jgi:hypothetical protein
LEQGPTEKTIVEQCIRNRMPLPQSIANAPELYEGLELFYVAFMELTTCRALGMAEGPIPWTAVQSYCNELGLVGEQREDMFFHIREMDTCYLEFRAKKTQQQSLAQSKGPRTPKLKAK